MIRINRKTEYGLIALQFLADRSKRVGSSNRVSARQIADEFNIPYPILSKILQALQRHGFVDSVQGTKGGYRLARPLSEISLADVVEVFEGPLQLTDCLGSKTVACLQHDLCNVKSLFTEVHNAVVSLLRSTKLDTASRFNRSSIQREASSHDPAHLS